ncbi:MAG: mannose-6-phosphate isomerase [Patescibacteria group bacterium]
MRSRKEKIYREIRPWGEFHQYTHNEISTVKTLIVKVGEGLSDQRHQKRYELWVFHTLGGRVSLEYVNGRKIIITPPVGGEVEIPPRTWHMLECLPGAPGKLRVTEISFGEFDEQDNERRFDRYGRR